MSLLCHNGRLCVARTKCLLISGLGAQIPRVDIVILLLCNGILFQKFLKTRILSLCILHLHTSSFNACFGHADTGLSGMDTACCTLRTALSTGQIGFCLSQTKPELGILNDNKRIALLHLLKFIEAHLAYKALHAAILGYDILAHTGIIRHLATTEMHKLTGSINSAAYDTKYHNRIRVEFYSKAQGIELPAVVPAGPDNPMGHHAIRLAAYGGVYLLHGTNADFGIGMRVSSGCIRLRDDDIKTLFSQVTPGTKVNIINTPIKVSAEPNGARLVEVHQPLSEKIDDDPQLLPITLNSAMQSFKDAAQTDAEVMQHVMDVRSGMPVDVRRHQVSPQTL